MSDELLVPAEWCKRLNVKVIDPDGWRGGKLGPKAWGEPISEAEFKLRLVECTIDTRGNDPAPLFDRALEAMHRTDVIVTVVHRFPVGTELVDVAGGLWKVVKIDWRNGHAEYVLDGLNDIARVEVQRYRVIEVDPDRKYHKAWGVHTVDRHFNPA